MSDDADTFRIQARLNRVEFADIEADLNQYPTGTARAGRIRLLMRLGYAAAHGQSHHAGPNLHPVSSKVVEISSHHRNDERVIKPVSDPDRPTESRQANVAGASQDSLDSIADLNPADFKFPVSP